MLTSGGVSMNVLVWGTYDLGKPRVRILLKGLESNGVKLFFCHYDIWKGVDDKSQVRGYVSKLSFFLQYLIAYPLLIFKYLRAPDHDVVIIPYLAQFDVIVLRPFAWLRRRKIIMDAFLSLYDTVIDDRKMYSPDRFVASALKFLDRFSCRIADRVLVDTNEQKQYFSNFLKIQPAKISRVFVGVEDDSFFNCESVSLRSRNYLEVLFYGQFIPLHGIETIVRAAELTQQESIKWRLIGQGQTFNEIHELIAKKHLKNVDWQPWVAYGELVEAICDADVCLGIFGTSDKASRVIPNKVFQILACCKPLITADTPAIREIISENSGIRLTRPGNAEDLAGAVREFKKSYDDKMMPMPVYKVPEEIYPFEVGRELYSIIQRFI